jgi:hypothetical protein
LIAGRSFDFLPAVATESIDVRPDRETLGSECSPLVFLRRGCSVREAEKL